MDYRMLECRGELKMMHHDAIDVGPEFSTISLQGAHMPQLLTMASPSLRPTV